MINIELCEFGKDFELFGKRIDYFNPIIESGNDGIIINELSRKINKDSNQTRREVMELERRNIVKIEKATDKGKTGNKKYITLTEKGKSLNNLFIQYSEFSPKELQSKLIGTINNYIDRFYDSKTDSARESSLNSLRESLRKEIERKVYNWEKIPKLKSFINNFLQNEEKYTNNIKRQFYHILTYLYNSGYFDKKNFEIFQSFLEGKEPSNCLTELYSIVPLTLYALKRDPENVFCYNFLTIILNKIKFIDESHENLISGSREIIYTFSENLKDKLFKEIDNIMAEFKDEKQPLLNSFIQLLA